MLATHTRKSDRMWHLSFSFSFQTCLLVSTLSSRFNSSCVNRYHGYAKETFTYSHQRISCSLATRDSPSYINPTRASGISRLSMRRWRIRGCTNVKLIRSRKSNYQFCSKWQVRKRHVREKFAVFKRTIKFFFSFHFLFAWNTLKIENSSHLAISPLSRC